MRAGRASAARWSTTRARTGSTESWRRHWGSACRKCACSHSAGRRCALTSKRAWQCASQVGSWNIGLSCACMHAQVVLVAGTAQRLAGKVAIVTGRLRCCCCADDLQATIP